MTDAGAASPAIRAPSTVKEQAPGLAVAVGLAVVAWALAGRFGLPTMIVAMVLGLLLTNLGGTRVSDLAPGMAFSTRHVLRWGIVLLGFRLTWGHIAALGATGVAVVATAVALTWITIHAVQRRACGVGALPVLLASGYAICGASAVAAVGGAVDADEKDIVNAMALVTAMGTLAAFVVPPVGRALGLSDEVYGWWVGLSIHDVAQVAAAGAARGGLAFDQAMLVKLTRVVMLVPTVVILGSRGATSLRSGQTGFRSMPGFVLAFVLAAGVASTGFLPSTGLQALSTAGSAFLTIALVALGAQVRISDVRAQGWRPLIVAASSWMTLAAGLLVAAVVGSSMG